MTMSAMGSRVTALFDSQPQAEQAITALRQLGVSDAQLSVVARHGGDTSVTGSGSVAEDTSNAGERMGKGALAGAGAGALFGLAAAAIPGVGPFITAGWLASELGVVGGAAAAGAIVGGTSGAMAGLFAKAGYDEHEAQHYGSAVEQGGIFIAVDTATGAVSRDQVLAVLTQNGGRLYSRAA